MIPADLFWEVGGFDAHYAPAYGEDSDLAFKVREAGRSVIFQPLSQIVHDEGVTSGNDLTKGVKAYQIQNLRKLATRWRQRLSEQFEPGQSIFLARERGVGLRVLVLDHCTPEPDKDAGSIIVLGIMRTLQSLGCKITFVPEDNYLFLERYTPDLQRLGIECLYAPFVTSVQHYLEQRGDAFDLVLIFRFTAASRNLDAVRRLAPQAKVILRSVICTSCARNAKPSCAATRACGNARRRPNVPSSTSSAAWTAPLCIAPSNRNCSRGKSRRRGWRCSPGSSTRRGPQSRSDPAATLPSSGVTSIRRTWTPRSSSQRKSFPSPARTLSDVRFQIIGSNPTAALRKLQSDSVDVVGFVPDLAERLDGLRLTVAPLRYGAGVKGKIATSLSHGVPCVVTPLAGEGMGLEHERNVLIAESPEEFAAAVVRLYQDEELWQSLSTNGLTFVRENYSFDGATRLFADILQGVGVEPVGGRRACQQRDGLEIVALSDASGDRAYRARARVRFDERASIERLLVPNNEAPFEVDGFCIGCQRQQVFKVELRLRRS